MLLYLVQHGKALSKEDNPERPLSDEGRADVSRIARFINQIPLSEIFESGKLRATETADIIGEVHDIKPQRTENLSPLDNPGEWAGELDGTDVDIMLVGHMPHLGKLASLLLIGAPETGVIEFSPGSVLCLEQKDQGWTVNWMVVPSMLG
jgi:phosphohistidine phosphatase